MIPNGTCVFPARGSGWCNAQAVGGGDTVTTLHRNFMGGLRWKNILVGLSSMSANSATSAEERFRVP
jgi:hypothetical protein